MDLWIKPDSILFFDLDGTLVDTDYANFLSYKKAIELVNESHFHISYDPTRRFNRKLLKSLVPGLTETALMRIIEEKEKCYNDYLPETRLNGKTAEILRKYSRLNKTVLVTNCRKNRALATLDYHELTDEFSNFFFRSCEKNHGKISKFQNAILNSGIAPESVIAFENEETEIAAARQAGISCINPLIPWK